MTTPFYLHANRIQQVVTPDVIRAAAAVGGLMAALSRFARGIKLKPAAQRRCKAQNPRVWKYIWGCDGEGIFSGQGLERVSGGGFRPVRVLCCAVCYAMQAADQVIARPEHQDLLAALQEEAGVEDYRYYSAPKSWTTWRERAEVLS